MLKRIKEWFEKRKTENMSTEQLRKEKAKSSWTAILYIFLTFFCFTYLGWYSLIVQSMTSLIFLTMIFAGFLASWWLKITMTETIVINMRKEIEKCRKK